MEEEEPGSAVLVGTGGKVGRTASSATWQLRPFPQSQGKWGEGDPYLAGVENCFPQADTDGLKWGIEGCLGPHHFPSGTSCPITTGSCLRAKGGPCLNSPQNRTC